MQDSPPVQSRADFGREYEEVSGNRGGLPGGKELYIPGTMELPACQRFTRDIRFRMR